MKYYQRRINHAVSTSFFLKEIQKTSIPYHKILCKEPILNSNVSESGLCNWIPLNGLTIWYCSTRLALSCYQIWKFIFLFSWNEWKTWQKYVNKKAIYTCGYPIRLRVTLTTETSKFCSSILPSIFKPDKLKYRNIVVNKRIKIKVRRWCFGIYIYMSHSQTCSSRKRVQ